ncbi:ATP-binding protein [Rhizobium leguminosarum]|uniref:ATP-binding protein n=1 Tax=Rhizobium leguminosarum TaxID=384 RepID=UPI003D7AE33B
MRRLLSKSLIRSTRSDGMGIGLSIARTIVESHRGSISARNNSAGGATFEVKIPLDIAQLPSGVENRPFIP